MTIAQQLKITTFPFDIKDENGNTIYYEYSSEDWCKWEYDQGGNQIYFENSDGYIIDDRPKPEPEPEPVKKQTAVEWLIKKLTNRQNGIFDGFPHLSLDEIYSQAKAMEKKQIQDAYWEGGRDVQTNVYKGMKEYYNETYGGDK
jgi:hypothetical protein